MTGPRVDLHVHSDASDGLLAPDELARRMRAAGCEVIALTDHDTTAGLASFAAAAPHAIAAIELTCRVRPGPRGTVHLLGYGVDPEQPELVEVAAANRAAKRAQVRAILQRLAREEGIEISWEDLALGGAARGEDAYVGRHHVAAVLVRRGHARTRLKAFRRFLSAERVPCAEVVPASEALAALQAAGGLAVLAHPTHDDLTEHLPRLAGLDGLEVYRPRVPAHRARKLARLASERGLWITGGSDWHGHAPEGPYGNWPGPPPGALDPFLSVLAQRAPR